MFIAIFVHLYVYSDLCTAVCLSRYLYVYCDISRWPTERTLCFDVFNVALLSCASWHMALLSWASWHVALLSSASWHVSLLSSASWHVALLSCASWHMAFLSWASWRVSILSSHISYIYSTYNICVLAFFLLHKRV